MTEQVLQHYGITPRQVQAFGSGLINRTWLVTTPVNRYILQRINTRVFTIPEAIAENIAHLAAYLQVHHPQYRFVTPVSTLSGSNMVHLEDAYFRLFPFVENSHTIDVVEAPQQAEEAAKQFGLFTRSLEKFDISQLRITLPGFHDLGWRYRQFEEAIKKGNPERIKQVTKEVEAIYNNSFIVNTYNELCGTETLIQRVTHHDTKISNVLFDQVDKGICVIDLDTVMPGFFISDVGDMMRTYLSPVSEEEKDLEKIEVRDAYFEAIVRGYLQPMADILTAAEKEYLVFAGQFMIYMQALRFLTDHLNNDSYYGAGYVGHNLCRAQNQLVLLQKLNDKQAYYIDLVHRIEATLAK